MLFAEPLANSQTVAWRDMGFVAEQNCCFIIVPIVVYLPFVVNLVVFIQLVQSKVYLLVLHTEISLRHLG